MRTGVTAVLVAVLLAASGCGGGAEPDAQPAPTSAPVTTVPPSTVPPTTSTTVDPNLHFVATAAVPEVAVYETPGAAEPVHRLENPQPSASIGDTTPLVMLVREQRPDWLRVLLPIRPNGSSGWVRESDVTLQTHDWRILVELGAHQITVWGGDQVFLQEPVGLGTAATPTTVGTFYTTEKFRITERNSAFGPFAFALSGFSEVHYEFAGGSGTLGIHGNNDPSALGRSVSNGCIRMSNTGITTLAENLPEYGVPVEIRA